MIWKAVKCSLTHADACEGTLLKFVSQALKKMYYCCYTSQLWHEIWALIPKRKDMGRKLNKM